MNQEAGQTKLKVKKIRLEKFDNDPDGNPIRDAGPVEIWEGEDESNMKCVFKREED